MYMQILSANPQIPLYPLEPDELTSNKHFRVYNFEGILPEQSDLLIPHRKEYYLIVFIRRASSRQWIDMTPYQIKDKTVYFYGPNCVIVKEETKQMWSTGIAFTNEFLSLQENASLSELPIIQNLQNGHELLLSEEDVDFVEDMLSKINVENLKPSEWQQRMLSAYLSLLLTYLSRLYTSQFKNDTVCAERQLLKKFSEKINECFREIREVSDYASMLNISAGHLSEVVKIQSGKPAIKHIHERVILEAKRLLFHTNNSLKEIGFDLGFSDASYFNRFFKRETGLTPVDYRVTIRKMYH
jgi:AraC family transcriptional activator of pobA